MDGETSLLIITSENRREIAGHQWNQPMREDIEHAFNSTRRLRLRLSSLAKLSSGHSQQIDLAASVTLEAMVALDVCACVFHRFTSDNRSEVLAFHKSEEIDEAKLK